VQSKTSRWIALWVLATIALGWSLLVLGCSLLPESVDTFERPPEDPFSELTDDGPPPKPAFDEALVDPRPLGRDGAIRVNQSAATFRLGVAEGNEADDAWLVQLHASYAAAAEAAAGHGALLPSIDLIDGKAKQFDDGLVAAVEVACVRGPTGRVPGIVDLTRRMLAAVGPDGPAAPRLAAALQVAGEDASAKDAAAIFALLREFEADEVTSKPSGFYDESDALRTTFRFLRFLMQPIDATSAEARDLASALARDVTIRADYLRAVHLFEGLTNPGAEASFADADWQTKRIVELLPRAHSQEDDLTERLFPDGPPPGANVMRELIRRVRSGEVDLTPRPNSGWYDRQTYALETLLLPERAAEHAKLELTKSYKKRLIRAFAALLVKRRETHWRSLAPSLGAKMHVADGDVRPRLRVEPAVTHYLRTARAYAFLAGLLDAVLGEEAMSALHGFAGGRERAPNLAAELRSMRDLHYGLALVAAEDIGMKAPLATDEPADAHACYAAATAWLAHAQDDADLAADTRVVVPVYVDPRRGTTRQWATVGVRLARLSVSYVEPPKLRPADGSAEWREAEPREMAAAEYLIPVDEFAEFEVTGSRVLTRGEFRAVCDRERTKEAIVGALRAGK